MALPLLTPHTPLLLKNPINLSASSVAPLSLTSPSPLLSSPSSSTPRFSSIRTFSTPPSDDAAGVTDEWGEKSIPDTSNTTDLSEADPVNDDDEWGADDVATGNGSLSPATAAEEVGVLKRCLLDTVYGANFGFQATAEVRAEVSEMVHQLEAANPTRASTGAAGLLDGNWVLVYTAFSELLPLLAIGTTPLLKVEKILQIIDASNLTIDNSTTLSSPLATFSFNASASYEVRSPLRIQVQFKEGTLQPPVLKSTVDFPENVEFFGQKINLSLVRQSLNPLQEIVASISQVLYGQPPLKVPIPGGRSESWLLTTYLDGDLRITRGDGGLFVLVKEGSPLLDQ